MGVRAHGCEWRKIHAIESRGGVVPKHQRSRIYNTTMTIIPFGRRHNIIVSNATRRVSSTQYYIIGRSALIGFSDAIGVFSRSTKRDRVNASVTRFHKRIR